MKLSIGKKLGLGFATVLALMFVSSGLTYTKSRDIREIEARVDIQRVHPKGPPRVAEGFESNTEQRTPGNPRGHGATEKRCRAKIV